MGRTKDHVPIMLARDLLLTLVGGSHATGADNSAGMGRWLEKSERAMHRQPGAHTGPLRPSAIFCLVTKRQNSLNGLYLAGEEHPFELTTTKQAVEDLAARPAPFHEFVFQLDV
jgi:hypothetical protein